MFTTYQDNQETVTIQVFVKAIEKGSSKSNDIVIKNEQGRLSNEEIARMLREAEENEEADKLAKERIDARQSLDNYIYEGPRETQGQAFQRRRGNS